MKIILFGGKGNLGCQLEKLINEDDEYNLISWDVNDIDVTDFDLVNRKISEIKPVLIINATAYNAVDKCEEDDEYERAKILNGEAVGNLAEVANMNDAVLLHYSSDYVFGGSEEDVVKEAKKEGGFSEDCDPHPINKYAETKLMGEREIISRSGKGLKYYLVRTSKIFGPKGVSDGAKPSFFDIMLRLAQEDKVISVVDSEESCFTYSVDLARASFDLFRERQAYGVYHIVNDGACTWYEGAKEFFKLAGLNPKVLSVTTEDFPRPAKRPEYSVLKNTKLKPLRDYKEALKEYLEIYKNN